MPSTSAVEILPLKPEKNRELLTQFHGEKTGWVQVGEKKFYFPSKYAQQAEGMSRFKSRADDIWISTFPRSGTTLTQEMAWLIGNDFDFTTARKVQLAERFPFFEFNIFLHDETKANIMKENNYDPEKEKAINQLFDPAYKSLEDMPSPRFIKTHLPLSLLPPDVWTSGAKVIYVARNPKDVAVSYFHLTKLWRTFDFKGGFEQFWEYFEDGLVSWGPFWAHVIEGWEYKDKPNMQFLLYEEMVKDLPKAIRKVANFLGSSPTEEQIQALSDHLDVKNFKSNPAVNFEYLRDLRVLTYTGEPFIRTGKIGGHGSQFTPELTERANKWIEENYKKTDFRFPQ